MRRLKAEIESDDFRGETTLGLRGFGLWDAVSILGSLRVADRRVSRFMDAWKMGELAYQKPLETIWSYNSWMLQRNTNLCC